MRIWPCQAAPRDEPRVGEEAESRSGAPHLLAAPCARLPCPAPCPRPARGGAGAAAAAHLWGRPLGGARPGPARTCAEAPGCRRFTPCQVAAAAARAGEQRERRQHRQRQHRPRPSRSRWRPTRRPYGAPRGQRQERTGQVRAGGVGPPHLRPRGAARRGRGSRGRAAGWVSAVPPQPGGGGAGRAALPKRAVSPRAQKPPFCFRCFLFSLLSRRRSEQMTYLCRSPSGAACASIFVSAVAFRSGAKRLAPPGLQPGPSTCPLPTERTNFS